MTSKIEWTGKTWNIFAGCSKVSEGCFNCYAIGRTARNAAMAKVMKNPGRAAAYEGLTRKVYGRNHWTGKVRFIQEALEIPLGRKKPTTYLVNSISDVFHPSVPDEWVDAMMAVILMCPQHTFQLLTKRPSRMRKYFSRLDLQRVFEAVHAFDLDGALISYDGSWELPASNLWLGTSVESQCAANERISHLLETPASCRWLSMEPLLEEVDLTQVDDSPETDDPFNALTDDIGDASYEDSRCEGQKIDWVVVGGESGTDARPLEYDWAESIVRQCKSFGVPVFVKQLGSNFHYYGVPTKLKSRKGSDMDEWESEAIKVREFPVAQPKP